VPFDVIKILYNTGLLKRIESSLKQMN